MDVDRAVATVRSWADAALESPVKYGAVAGSIALAGYLIYLIFIRHYFSSFYNLPGPPSSNWFWGNMREILEGDGQITTQFEWAHYGPTYRRWTIMGATEGTTFDFKAIAYMWQHPDLFHKPLGPNLILSDVLGKGLVTVEGAVHRRQRRVLNPAFGIMQIQGMAPMIFEKAYELRDRMQRMLDDSPTPGSRKFEMIQEVSDCSLDIIGMAGFDVDLGGISAIPNSLRETYAIGQSTIGMMTPLTLLQMQIPATRCFTPNKRTRIVTASRKIAGTLVAERKRQLAAEGTALEKSTFGKDVLSLLLKANMAPDLRDDQRLTDLEVVDQIATVLFAGHETTSTAMTWLLYLLSRHTDIQDRLRKELLDVDADEPDSDTLNSLHFLDNVIREALRLEPPVPFSARAATKDAIIPLETPMRGRNGKLITELKVKKGDTISTPLAYINQMPSIWGADASEFNPDRFDRDEKRPVVPGVYGNLVTFLGGPHNCIGHRLTILEMKVMVYALIRNFKFNLPPNMPAMTRSWLIIQRPVVVGEEHKGPQMPLIVSPA